MMNDRLLLREHQDRGGCGLRKKKVAFRHAARDLQIEKSLREGVAGNEFLFEMRPLRIVEGIADSDLVQRSFEAAQMRLVVDETAAEDADAFIDAVAEQEAAIHHRHARLFERDEGAIEKDDSRHHHLRTQAENEIRMRLSANSRQR
jgi:hypothetical protein